MLRLLSYTPLPVHLGLLIVIPLLRLPTFHPEFFLPEESLLLVTAQKMVATGGLYQDAWFGGPPLMVWLYGLFSLVFGDWAMPAIRVFSCLYIYASAIVFNGILAEYKSFRRNAGLISVLFVLLVCTPWFAQQMNATLFTLLPVILTFSHINQLGDRNPQNQRHVFIAGVWMMVAMMATYKTVFLLIGVFFAYLVLKPFRWEEMMAFIGGLLTVAAAMLFWLFRWGGMDAWLDQGLLYYADYLGLANEAMYQIRTSEALLLLLVSWGSFLVLAVVGFVHYRLNFYGYVKKARSAETMMYIWLVGVLIVLLFKLGRLEISDFLLLVPPLAFYIARTFDFPLMTRFRVLALLLLVMVPVWQYTAYAAMLFPNQWGWVAPLPVPLRDGGMQLNQEKFAGLLGPLADLPPGEQVWVMSNDNDLYLRSKRIPAVPYVDFRMAYYKLEDLPGHRGKLMISEVVPAREMFRTFSGDQPAMVLDGGNYFPSLQQRFPGIFGEYQALKVGTWTLYTAP